jgi:hypothetical protein
MFGGSILKGVRRIKFLCDVAPIQAQIEHFIIFYSKPVHRKKHWRITQYTKMSSMFATFILTLFRRDI